MESDPGAGARHKGKPVSGLRALSLSLTRRSLGGLQNPMGHRRDLCSGDFSRSQFPTSALSPVSIHLLPSS